MTAARGIRAIRLAFLLTVAAAGPGHAARPDWKVANTAYLAARATGEAPQTPEQVLDCASYWAVWAEVGDDGRVPKAARPLLDLDLATLNAQLAAVWWAARLPDDAYDAYRARQKSLTPTVDAALGGDAKSFKTIMDMLGRCQPPRHERGPQRF
jgi:hypothetical protein